MADEDTTGSPEAPAQGEAPTEEAPRSEADEDFNYIVRIANTDLDGNKPVFLALTGVKGIGERVASVLTDEAGVDRTARIGSLDEAALDRISEAVGRIEEIVPGWMVNRRKDYESGDDLHLLRQELDGMLRQDLNRLKKIRSYRGVRHERGQKVRGQRTRANGRSGMAMGVSRKKVQQQEGT